ncbi:hypothetical protein UFOVP1151_29 [uncultured Caudovirales phage]|uniref:Uncharacterized protein n=1 Tax=uncultured Caudovirales phage TaxID=2100421 RepID=A0A6J5QVL0_9CAUD|nr:hypothetical protein UFOVP1151_29 [uncultured Caudovirales phage]
MLFSDLISFIKENRFKGRRQSFQLDDEGLEQYIRWAFCRNYLMLVSSEKGISGVAIAYALPKPYDGRIETLIPYDNELKEDTENKYEICVMDWIAQDSESRKNLINQFTIRFPNWENQQKWGIQFGLAKQLTNKYMNLLKGIN